jgi:glycosyltransferase involved in cell wall biosynthesis
MKVALNCRAHDGPWGGGNRFVLAITEALAAAGHRATHALDADVDAIVLIDPRARNPMLTFGAGAALRHIAWRNPRTIVVHRINECDERKGTRDMNRRLRLANYAADHTVFIATWLKDLAVWRHATPTSVIHNGADPAVFHARGFTPWPGYGPMRFVTHHWGAHELKGFDVYRRVDTLLDDPAWRARIALTSIGNLPATAKLRNVETRAPLDGVALADALREHHAYLTGSINEPGGMHHVEGAMCGLPIVYRRSGALPEYCAPFGIGYDGPHDLVSALEHFVATYPGHVAAMRDYPYSAARTTREWIALLERLVGARDAVAAQRRIWRDPLAFALNQLPL